MSSHVYRNAASSGQAHATGRPLPLIDTTFAVGEVSYSKVRAITRVATPENEDYVLHIARYGTASHIEGLGWRSMRCCGGIELRAGKSDVHNLLQGLLILKTVVRWEFD